ncbi:uncharacterized protein LOC103580352 isoform X1 [Microplitis demolitor]|uniref:uncharacterized protein LOC103580352 isoform X1 n=1 Tax=Microplitis demolitor TaxID=69319 RepID=UPI0004CD434A|nr:uncharacterized protein LOC103580352 isoform X1 [Microplitis demolitor]XP_053599235.1 uncharacterized protein LOC103580352 isoform X1 [Microplitis demolitor]
MSDKKRKRIVEWAMRNQRPKSRKHENTEDTPKDGTPAKTPEPRRSKKKITKPKSSSGPSNPFLIFFLRMRSKKPNEHVTVIARAAGRQWAKMTPDQRQKYVNLANSAKKRKVVKKKKKRDEDERDPE